MLVRTLREAEDVRLSKEVKLPIGDKAREDGPVNGRTGTGRARSLNENLLIPVGAHFLEGGVVVFSRLSMVSGGILNVIAPKVPLFDGQMVIVRFIVACQLVEATQVSRREET